MNKFNEEDFTKDVTCTKGIIKVVKDFDKKKYLNDFYYKLQNELPYLEKIFNKMELFLVKNNIEKKLHDLNRN